MAHIEVSKNRVPQEVKVPSIDRMLENVRGIPKLDEWSDKAKIAQLYAKNQINKIIENFRPIPGLKVIGKSLTFFLEAALQEQRNAWDALVHSSENAKVIFDKGLGLAVVGVLKGSSDDAQTALKLKQLGLTGQDDASLVLDAKRIVQRYNELVSDALPLAGDSNIMGVFTAVGLSIDALKDVGFQTYAAAAGLNPKEAEKFLAALVKSGMVPENEYGLDQIFKFEQKDGKKIFTGKVALNTGQTNQSAVGACLVHTRLAQLMWLSSTGYRAAFEGTDNRLTKANFNHFDQAMEAVKADGRRDAEALRKQATFGEFMNHFGILDPVGNAEAHRVIYEKLKDLLQRKGIGHLLSGANQ